MGECKITTMTSEKRKEINEISTQSIVESSKEFESTTSSREEDKTYTSTYDGIDHEKPPSSKEMEALYGKGYQLLKQFGYNGKGCGMKEKGIRVPIEPNIQETTRGLVYCPSRIMKASKMPSLNINFIM